MVQGYENVRTSYDAVLARAKADGYGIRAAVMRLAWLTEYARRACAVRTPDAISYAIEWLDEELAEYESNKAA